MFDSTLTLLECSFLFHRDLASDGPRQTARAVSNLRARTVKRNNVPIFTIESLTQFPIFSIAQSSTNSSKLDKHHDQPKRRGLEEEEVTLRATEEPEAEEEQE